MKTTKEIAERLYNLNAQISFKWIGLRKQPTELEISDLNRILGEAIKDLREISETNENTRKKEWKEIMDQEM